MPEINRSVPHNIESEEIVLGSCLISGYEALAQISDWLKPEHFYREKNGEIYRTLLGLYSRGEGTDFVLVCNDLEHRDKLAEVGGASYLASLINAVPTAFFVEHHARLVLKAYKCRKLIQFGGSVVIKAYEEPENIEAAIGEMVTELLGTVESAKRNSPHPDDIIGELMGRDTSQVSNLSFKALNQITGGIEPTHLWAIGGFSSTGKTAFALQLMLDLLWQGKRCLYFSLEMARYQLMARMLANRTGIPMWRIMDNKVLADEERQQWAESVNDMANLRDRLWIYDDCYGIAEMTYLCRKHKIGAGLDVVFVDYLQNLRGGDNEYERLSDAAKLLQNLAKQLNCCIVVLSQISNEQASGGMGSQDAYSFKGSGALRDVADKAIMLVRDRNRDMGQDIGALRVMVRKNRHGPTGETELRFAFATGQIWEGILGRNS